MNLKHAFPFAEEPSTGMSINMFLIDGEFDAQCEGLLNTVVNARLREVGALRLKDNKPFDVNADDPTINDMHTIFVEVLNSFCECCNRALTDIERHTHTNTLVAAMRCACTPWEGVDVVCQRFSPDH